MGRAGVYSRFICLKDGKVTSIGLGYNNCMEHSLDASNIVSTLWKEVRFGCAFGSTIKDKKHIDKISKVLEKNNKLASRYSNTIYANSMIPSSVYKYSHKIGINNSTKRKNGSKCLLNDGNYTLLSVGLYGFNTDKWDVRIDKHRVVDESYFFDMEYYQTLQERAYKPISVVSDSGEENDGSLCMAGVWSGVDPYFYILCNNEDYIKQIKDAIGRGSVALYTGKNPSSEGLCLSILDV